MGTGSYYLDVSNNSDLTPKEKYEKEAQEKLAKYVVGGTNPSGNKISWIFMKSDEYIVYEVETADVANSIRVVVEPWTENDENNLLGNFFEIKSKYTEVRGLLYKVSNFQDIKSKIASIISTGIMGNVDNAKAQFDTLIEEISRNYRDQFRNRLRYLASVLFFVVSSCVLSISTYYCNLFDELPVFRDLVFSFSAGAIGGFVSVSRRIKQMTFEKDVDSYLYVFYGIERALISSFSAVIIYFVISSNIALGIVNDLSQPLYGVIVFSFMAGFSETLVPNLLIKLENENG